ncbi:YggS family pyridoxal phosphate enzyme [Erwinia sp. OLTSP20]|uniref:YggS family pyridoxal phosphate-dependent enzyme n=1 Tax=unclassified Erwinia TaxID=2622719 RepID=UPI000C182281|nr:MULTISPECIES: YggS family pyridoxal phosphate-dependent enzyme [unclassified Erwinia]PIJ48902.1 YggS family pyridoxal phosphate enzyme [Erwinia sp. OAMSP11]PIJ74555.1 YggS family pyridoxal phosphate enzyme [Erwinia sp. OLSSP12]PIJ79586.1 YggS family pyridoxal phosphate enzyme [Erwinia sp. OLCASP19]PIJ80371.1 YggS family pyridoxal phosphate enzyme [Erwinia sp. OLMTSP26]PIJ82486.1 YggS family pyridoxal phosphate enzyme [Erwinia sp. OLMDSP33]
MTVISHNLDQVRQRITHAALRCGRDPTEIMLIAVSKTQSVNAIEQAMLAGQRSFGENYVQEALDKISAMENCALIWHFIGPLQSNKSRLVAENFAWLHTLDRLKLAQRLNAQRPEQLEALNVLIQVNISDENSKSGIMLDDVAELAREVVKLPRLRLRGLMAIPAPENSYQRQLAVCQRMARAFEQLKAGCPSVDTLSLGMSDDMEAAIAAGSTMVRIGTAIFGSRHYA